MSEDVERIAAGSDERAEMFAEMLDLLSEADRRIAWESHGLGNTFAERVEQVIVRAFLASKEQNDG